MRAKLISVLVLLFLTFNLSVLAGQVDLITGNVFKGPPKYVSASNDYYLIEFSTTSVKSYYVASASEDYTEVFTEKTWTVPSSSAYVIEFKFTCNTPYIFKAYDSNGSELGKLHFKATNIVNGTCDSTGENEDNFVENDCGCVFDTPGWNDYMGKVDDIIGAIPPPPNWGEVADTFKETIVPAAISGLDDLLGRAPTPPSAPSAPSPPPKPPPLSDNGIKPPTGQEIPSGGEFTENDIKNQAPMIQERDDPTGGFTIDNPVESLPSIDEFKENIPNEGTAPLPSPPKELENKAPQPPEQANPAPSPSEGNNVAPKPSEGSNTAPMPNEGSNTAPKPNEGNNNAPIPGRNFGTPPTPGSSGGTAPMPGNDFGSFPMPKN